MMDLPQKNIIFFSTDGPNVMKSFRRKMQETYPDIIDVGEFLLHKVHNCFAQGTSAFGSDVGAAVVDDYFFF